MAHGREQWQLDRNLIDSDQFWWLYPGQFDFWQLRGVQFYGSKFTDTDVHDEMQINQWLKPLLVAQIEFTEWTPDGHLRHSSFAGLRNDKEARRFRRKSRPRFLFRTIYKPSSSHWASPPF
jgi:hypothetical protein